MKFDPLQDDKIPQSSRLDPQYLEIDFQKTVDQVQECEKICIVSPSYTTSAAVPHFNLSLLIHF